MKKSWFVPLMFVVACASTSNTPAGASQQVETAPLYDRLGQKPAITAVVDDFVANVGADTRINSAFANTDLVHFKQLLVAQICQATGGPCTYTGRTMLETHKGMNITEDQFTATVEDLVKALDKHNVPEKEKNELLSALGGMKGDIVGQ